MTPVQGSRFKADEEDSGRGYVSASGSVASGMNKSASETSMDTSDSGAPAAGLSSSASSTRIVIEDSVDVQLAKLNGRIEVGLTPQCQHKASGQKCLYCASVEPYDEAHLKKEGIKFMSFQSYLRKLRSGLSGGKFAPLEDVRCTIKPGCTTHKPWPKAVCSTCQVGGVMQCQARAGAEKERKDTLI